MKYANQYIKSALSILDLYDGALPMAAFLKQYFAQHKKYGSRDRKYIMHVCYCYFRLGHACLHLPVERRLRLALYLCHDTPGVWTAFFEETWLQHWSSSITDRIAYAHSAEPSFVVTGVFPWMDSLSEGIDATAFAASHFVQPDLFLRIRPGQEKKVRSKLETAGIPFQSISPTCLSLPNASKVDDVLAIDKEVVIQDRNSQRVLELLGSGVSLVPNGAAVWDCCAASGGKSILAKDTLKDIKLTVSDIRSSILNNLQQRLQRADVNHYHAFTADLASDKPIPEAGAYQLIICDAPCSGSGTWGRTPEQLYYFEKEQIEQYASLQKKIITHVQEKLAADGYLLYITCSVFQNENEGQVSFIQQHFPLELVTMQSFKGYDLKADSMFAALFKKRAHHVG